MRGMDSPISRRSCVMILTPTLMRSHLEALCSMDQGTIGEPWGAEHLLLNLPGKWELSRLLVADEGLPLGFAVASRKGSHLHIHRLVVRDSERRRGLATQLVRALVEGAREHRLDLITLKVDEHNTRAISFYERLGFSWVGRESSNLLLSRSSEP